MRPQLSPERARFARPVARACPLAFLLLVLIVPTPALAQSRASDAAMVRVRVVESVPSVSLAQRSEDGGVEVTVVGQATIQVDGGPPVELDARRARTVSLSPVSNPRATHRPRRLVRVRIET